jgi:hypothetical protein
MFRSSCPLRVILSKRSPAIEGAGERSEMMKRTWRKWAVLATVLVALLTGSATFGEDPEACYET